MKILGVIALVLLGMYGCYHAAAPSATIRYKLILTVNDNSKQYTGSSVVEVSRQDTTKIFSGIGGYGGDYKGEAVAVDMGEKGVLFALLRGKDSVDYPLYIFMKSFPEYFPARADVTVIDGMRKLDHENQKPVCPSTSCRCWCASAILTTLRQWSWLTPMIWKRLLAQV